MHQPAVGESGHGQASDIEIQAAEILRMRTWLEETMARHTNRTQEQVNKDIDRDKILGRRGAGVRRRRPGADVAQARSGGAHVLTG
jgi:ATP-dependent Clp protease protease subunit